MTSQTEVEHCNRLVNSSFRSAEAGRWAGCATTLVAPNDLGSRGKKIGKSWQAWQDSRARMVMEWPS